MSKTNHRVNKEERERLNESKAHKIRRNYGAQLDNYVSLYNDSHDPEAIYEELFDEVEFEPYQKMRRSAT
jgi:hypothetical protein